MQYKKNVLIVGANSFIGRSFSNLYRQDFNITELDVLDSNWELFDFSGFDTILHVAAIVHKPNLTNEEIYYKVNADLPTKVAKIAVAQGVKHFIFISTASVWGIGPIFASEGKITRMTPLNPIDLYGKSKLKGEQNLVKLNESIDFKLSIVRPPNVYGENCPGNFYHILEKLGKLRLFPKCGNNKFSLINIDKLCHAFKVIIEKEIEGEICPQDEPIQTVSERIKDLALLNGFVQYQFSILAPLFRLINKIHPNKYLNNLYGGFYYDTNDYPNP